MTRFKRPLTLALLGVLLVSSFAIFAAAPVQSATSPPSRFLSLSALPPRLPTSSSGVTKFPSLVVSVNNAAGDPDVSPNSTVVYLSSSQSAVLSVQSTVTIPAGAQYVVADISTTATPGNSTITAVSPGFQSASLVVQTFTARGYPTRLRVFPLPSTFPAGQATSTTFAVAVVDGAGLPARTIQATSVNVTSSDTAIASVSDAIIPLNQTVGYGTLRASGINGSAGLTATASGLVSSSAVVASVSNFTSAIGLLVTPPPTALPANGGTYNVLTVSLLDKGGKPATASSVVQVLLSSSRTDIATTPDVVTITPGQSYVNVPITTSPAAGATFITASAANFASFTTEVDTVNIPPTQLGIYLADNKALVSKGADTLNIVVQLQDAQGIPAEARTPANVIISFSNNTLQQVPLTLTIPKGADLAYTSITLPGATVGTFTAISNGLASASVAFQSSVLQFTKSFYAVNPTLTLGGSTPVYFSLSYGGAPLTNAKVTWVTTGGTISSDSNSTGSTGTWAGTFIPTAIGVGSVTVTATDGAFGSTNATLDVVVNPAQVTHSTSLETELTTFPYVLILVGAAAAVVVVVFLFIRRRRKGAEADEALSEDEQGFNYVRLDQLSVQGVG